MGAGLGLGAGLMIRRAAAQVLRHFEDWVRADEMRGCAHPDDRDDISNGYLAARERMLARLTKVDQLKLRTSVVCFLPIPTIPSPSTLTTRQRARQGKRW